MNRTQLVVSLRSRGLLSIQRKLVFDLRYNIANFFSEVADVFLAAIYTFAFMSWSSWISLAITLIAAGKATQLEHDDLPLEGVFWPLFSYVILPVLMLLAWAFWRRERANTAMAHAKALLVSMLLQASSLVPPAAMVQKPAEATSSATPKPDAPSAAAQQAQPQDTKPTAAGATNQPQLQLTAIAAAALELRISLLALLDDLHAYLAHNRPYARHFFAPYLSNENPRGTLVRSGLV